MKQNERLLDNFGYISDKYIAEAAPPMHGSAERGQLALRLATAVACILLIAAVGLPMLLRQGNNDGPLSAGDAAVGDSTWENHGSIYDRFDTEYDGNDTKADSTAQIPDILPGEVPDILTFKTLGEIAELRSMIGKDEKNVMAYIEDHRYGDRLSSASDIEEIFDDIGELSFLYLDEDSGYTLENIAYCEARLEDFRDEYKDIIERGRRGYLILRYARGKDSICFVCSPWEDSFPDRADTTAVVGAVLIGDCELEMHGEVKDGTVTTEWGYMWTGDTGIYMSLCPAADPGIFTEFLSHHLHISTVNDITE